MKSAIAGLSADIPLHVNTAAAALKIASVKGLLSDLSKKIYAARLITEDTKFQAQLARDYDLLVRIDKFIAEPEVDLLGALKSEAQLLGIAAGLERVNAILAKAHIGIDDADLERRLALLIVQLSDLGARAYQVRVTADPRELAGIDRLLQGITLLSDKVSTIDFNVIGVEQLTEAEQEFARLNMELGTLLPQSVDRARRAWFGWLGLLGRRPILFGGLLGTSGLLGSIAVWHLLADAIIEFVAVLGPALLALGAFAAAAADSARNVYANISAINVVSAATHVSVTGLGGAFARLETAMAPHVYEIFGAALQVINNRMGLFSRLATGAAGVMDQLAARAERAITSSSFDQLLAHAISDLAKLADIAGNVFGIFGNLIKMISVWAQVLLTGVDVATRALENFTALPVVQAIGRWVVGVHGFWIWVGLATTAVLYAIPAFARMIGVLSEAGRSASGFQKVSIATQDLKGAALGMVGRLGQLFQQLVRAGLATRLFSVAEEDAGKGTKILAAGVGALTSIPVWGWGVAAAAALAALGIWLARNKTATEQWAASLQATIDKTATWVSVTGQLAGALGQANKAVSDNARATASSAAVNTAAAIAYGKNAGGAQAAATHTRDLAAVQQQFAGELNTTGFRLGEMARRFGGLSNAIGLAIVAGIKVKDLMHASATVFAQDLEQITALVRGYQQMGIGADALGNSVKALEVTTNDQITNVQRMTQAWTQFFQIVSGGESTFVTFAQDMLAIPRAALTSSTALTAAQGHVASAQATLNRLQGSGTATANQLTAAQDRLRAAQGRLTLVQSQGAASLTGLNASSLTLRQNWLSSISAAQAYYNALQTQSAAATDAGQGQILLLRAGEDLIRILAPAAKGSDILKQSIYALAQQFGISTGEMQDLIHHTGSLKSNEKDLQVVNDLLARSVSNVGRDWARMATTLNDQVKSALDAVALKSSGAAYAASQLYQALHSQGPASREAHDWYVKLITDLHNAGLTWSQARDYAAAYTKGIGFNASEIQHWHQVAQSLTSDTTKQKQLFGQIKVAVDQYTTSMDRNKASIGSGAAQRAQLITQLEQAGLKAHLSSGQIDTMIQSILHLNRTQLKLLMTGDGHFSIQQVVSLSKPGGKLAGPLAAGGMIHGGTPGRDSVVAALMPGEVVVPTHMVRAGAVDHLRGRLPGFAKGGMAGSFSGDVLAGTKWVSGLPNTFRDDMIATMESAMRSALNAAKQAAVAALSFRPGGSKFGGSAAAIAFARALLPPGWSWPALFSLWQRESGWNPYAVNPTSGAYGIPQCYSTDMMILTRRGWLKHNEVRVGDETVGYNETTRRSEWTRITAVLHPGVHRVVRYGNSQVEFTTTPNHRWLMRDKRTKTEGLREIQDRRARSILILAKPHYAEAGLPITPEEAALLGWIAGDGWERKAYPKYGTGRRGGSPATFHISQTKQENWPDIERALAGHGGIVRTRERMVGEELRLDREWRLSAPYARDLTERAGHPKADHRAMVLAMSSAQRKAWLDAMFLAEGSIDTRTAHKSISQNDGSLAETIRLAVYLEGYRPSVYRRVDRRYGTENLIIGFVKPTLVVDNPGFFYEDAGEQEVWCVTTELGSFTAEQGGHIHLTGNSLGHGHPYALGDYANQIRWGLAYIRSRYGNSQNAWAHEVSAGWYDRGGWLPPGLSVALNTTGRPEPVGAAGMTVNINVKVDPVIAAITPDRQLGQAIAQHVTQAIKGGLRLYPTGIAPR